MTNWFLVGCGYVGTSLARRLTVRGDEVTIARRDAAEVERIAGELGVRGVRADLVVPETLAGVIPPESIVVCLAPPGVDPAAEIQALLAVTADAKKLVYVSSTGVYAPGGGAVVDERWPLEPTTVSGRRRLAAEGALASASIPWIALRAAGIYGPGRGIESRLRDGTYRIIGDGTSHVSRIHIADLVTALVAAGEGEVTGFVNVADDDPAPIGPLADALAASLGLPAPPRVDPSTVDVEVRGMLLADRRISNHRLKQELGVTLAYPTLALAR